MSSQAVSSSLESAGTRHRLVSRETALRCLHIICAQSELDTVNHREAAPKRSLRHT